MSEDNKGTDFIEQQRQQQGKKGKQQGPAPQSESSAKPTQQPPQEGAADQEGASETSSVSSSSKSPQEGAADQERTPEVSSSYSSSSSEFVELEGHVGAAIGSSRTPIEVREGEVGVLDESGVGGDDFRNRPGAYLAGLLREGIELVLRQTGHRPGAAFDPWFKKVDRLKEVDRE